MEDYQVRIWKNICRYYKNL